MTKEEIMEQMNDMVFEITKLKHKLGEVKLLAEQWQIDSEQSGLQDSVSSTLEACSLDLKELLDK